MKLFSKVFPLGHFIISFLFVVCALALIILALLQLWHAFQFGDDNTPMQRLNAVLETIALLTVAVAALEYCSPFAGITNSKRFGQAYDSCPS